MGFKNLLNIIDSERKLFIQMHRPPDPDCLACAFILKEMLSQYGVTSTIVYTGNINRYETKELISRLNIPLYKVDTEENKGLIRQGNQIIVVDCQKNGGNVTIMDGEYIACIDHHPELDNSEIYKYCDIRPQYGACISILYEYAREIDYEIKPSLAALMLHGIKVDTGNLGRKRYLHDIGVFADLYRIADMDILSFINRNAMRLEDLNMVSSAYGNIVVKARMVYSYAGPDRSRESLAGIADDLITVADVDFAVVYSNCFNGYSFSVRSQDPCKDAGRIVNRLFAKLRGEGGGHVNSAGGVIPKTVFMDFSTEGEKMNHIIFQFEKLFEEISGERSEPCSANSDTM